GRSTPARRGWRRRPTTRPGRIGRAASRAPPTSCRSASGRENRRYRTASRGNQTWTMPHPLREYVAAADRRDVPGVVCNALHQVEQRVCRWLLVTHDKAAADFPATQDFLAARLGVKRLTISLVAKTPQCSKRGQAVLSDS